MLGWFKPRCPINLREQVWTELQVSRLVENWGWQRLCEANVVLPSRHFFQLPAAGEPIDVDQTFADVCRYLGATQATLRLEVVPAEALPNGSSEYINEEVATVRIADTWLDDLESLIAVMAHHVALDRLLREGLANGDESDLGWRADIACAFFGMGVFGANIAAKQRSGTDDGWTWWRIRSRAQLPARVFGYAMALFTLSRGERRPAWTRWLTGDALDTFQRGVRYLERNDDYIFDYEARGTARAVNSVSSLAADLKYGSAAKRLAALWLLATQGSAAKAAVQEIVACLKSRNLVLQSEAAQALGTLGPEASVAAGELMRLLGLRDREVRCSAAIALGQLMVPLDSEGPHGYTLFEELQLLLDAEDLPVVHSAAFALRGHGHAAEAAAVHFVNPLRRSLVDCHYDAQDLYFAVLETITGDVERFVKEQFADRHPELLPDAISSLEQFRQHQSGGEQS